MLERTWTKEAEDRADAKRSEVLIGKSKDLTETAAVEHLDQLHHEFVGEVTPSESGECQR